MPTYVRESLTAAKWLVIDYFTLLVYIFFLGSIILGLPLYLVSHALETGSVHVNKILDYLFYPCLFGVIAVIFALQITGRIDSVICDQHTRTWFEVAAAILAIVGLLASSSGDYIGTLPAIAASFLSLVGVIGIGVFLHTVIPCKNHVRNKYIVTKKKPYYYWPGSTHIRDLPTTAHATVSTVVANTFLTKPDDMEENQQGGLEVFFDCERAIPETLQVHGTRYVPRLAEEQLQKALEHATEVNKSKDTLPTVAEILGYMRNIPDVTVTRMIVPTTT